MKIWLLIIIIFFSSISFARDYPINRFIKDLGTDDQEQSFRLNNLFNEFRNYDTNTEKALIKVIENRVKQDKSKFLQIRFQFFKMFIMRFFGDEIDTQIIKTEFQQSLAMAKDLKNEMLLADGYYWYAIFLNEHQHVAESFFYNLKAIELMEKLGPEKFYDVNNRFKLLGELLYHTREYPKSIEYSKKAFYLKSNSSPASHRISILNNIGLAFKKLNQADSAILYFNKSAKLAASLDQKVWVTIPNANKAQVWFEQKKYKEAYPLFEADYNESTKVGDYTNAANNLQWMAKIDLAENSSDSALKKATQALKLLGQQPRSGAIANTYQTLSAIYKKQNKPDSSDHYSLLYNILRDSTEAAVAISNSEIVQLRVDDERNKSKIELLQKEYETGKISRNLLIVFVLILALSIYLLFNRHQAKQKKLQELKEEELNAANEQMQLFTKTIAENLEKIETLQKQIDRHNIDPSIRQNLEILKQKTILTDEDWEVFQNLFEKIYNGFFERIKKINPTVTSAELRFASIIRLQMNNKQAGAMLGISPDSARKTRLRLRQRLNLTEELNIEQVILSL